MLVKKSVWPAYVKWILLTQAVGGLSGFLNRDSVRIYTETIIQPPLSPPSAVFPVVWGVLFTLMGIAAARVSLTPPSRERTRGLILYGVQLAFNFCWSFLFFRFQRFGLALLWLTALWGLILWMALVFRRVDAPAAWLQAPYLLWMAFAGYLNAGVWLLN